MVMNDYELSKELDYLLASYLFENKLQMKRLLSYLVHNANASSESAFDQRAIAKECLGRSAEFDPAENPVVRIEIGRLRKLLNRFYEEELPRPYSIRIPLGQYRPKITVESIEDKTKYLPELIPSPANPERLSVLLQFATEGLDTQELYLLRHQIRIGITIALGKQEAVRLLVAIPGENGKVADSIDFIMRVSLASDDSCFKLSSEVCSAESDVTIFSNQRCLGCDYSASDVDELLSMLVSELFDHEIGLLWREWVHKRKSYSNIGAQKVDALVQYQRYLFDETETNSKLAFASIKDALAYHPGDKVINLALADIYYRMIMHDYQVVTEPIEKGLTHIREALRFLPASENLQTLHAFLIMFQQKYDFMTTSLLAGGNGSGATFFSFSFHYQVLKCLMSEWTGEFYELKGLCKRFACYPKLYPVLAYLNYFFEGEKAKSEKWRLVIRKESTCNAVRQCVKHMKLPKEWSRKGRRQLLDSIISDLGRLDD